MSAGSSTRLPGASSGDALVEDNIVKLAASQSNKAASLPDEDTIALAFAERHADSLRFVADWNKWMSFDGVQWQRDSTLHVYDRVRMMCREAADTSQQQQQRAVKSAKTVAAVEKLARSDRRLAATVDQWDSEPMRLTADGITYDL